VTALVAVTIYISVDAISVIKEHGKEGDEVNIIFLYAFAAGNFFVDLISSIMFYLRGKDALVNVHDTLHAPLRTFSLDRSSIDMGKRSLLPNLNMISALTHVGSDTLRTASVFIAALIATFGKQNGNLCDAWAAVVVSITIFAAIIPLCTEIYKAATTDIDQTDEEEAVLK
jgi:Co/Zn/Cd efflux system component